MPRLFATRIWMYKFCTDFKEVVVAVKTKPEVLQQEFFTGLRWFPVYSNTANCKPYNGQKVTDKQEHKIPNNKFALAGKTLLKENIGLIIVGNVPRELSSGSKIWS